MSSPAGTGQSGLDTAGTAWGIETILTINIVTCTLVSCRCVSAHGPEC